jgi:multidrug resistance efflux pump
MLKYSFLNKLVISSVIAAAVIGGIIYLASNNGGLQADIVKAQIRNLEQVVSVTGTIKSSQEIDLAFEVSGRVANIFVNLGDEVARGQRLISLDMGELIAQLNEAEANLAVQRVKLEEFRKGTRIEEISIAAAKFQGAKDALTDAKANFINNAKDAYTKADDAVRNKVDQFFLNPRSSNPELSFQPNNIQTGNELERSRGVMEELLIGWNVAAGSLSINSDLAGHAVYSKGNLIAVKEFLDTAASVVNSLSSTANLSQATIDKYRSDVSIARANINTAIANFAVAEEKLNSANSNLMITERELELRKAGATLEQILAQEALVRQAEAKLQLINSQLDKTVLRAPFSGVVAKKDIKIGEIVSVNKPVISVIGQDDFEIETFIPEADIASVSVGDKAKVTLDAYGNDVLFEAEVILIDPAETVVGGVAAYKTILVLDAVNGRIKSGMTANIDISADRRENVIAVPTRSVIYSNGNRILRVFIEIISGVEAGEEVIVFIRD